MSEVEASILSDIFSSKLTPTDVESAILSRTSYPDPWLADNTDTAAAIFTVIAKNIFFVSDMFFLRFFILYFVSFFFVEERGK